MLLEKAARKYWEKDMKLKIVNEQEKNIVYLVTDTTESFNLPRLGENEILLAGSSLNSLKQYDTDSLKVELKENRFSL